MQLVGEILAEEIPAILVVTMIDEMKARNGAVNIAELRRALGIQVIAIVGNKGIGIDDLRHALANPKTWVNKKPKVPKDIEERFEWTKTIWKKMNMIAAKMKMPDTGWRIILSILSVNVGSLLGSLTAFS